jgi:ABC-2 type transport system ATP-binding protein
MSTTQNPVPSITLDKVFAGYNPGNPVFENASFRLEGPGLIHLKGRNGSGKSTFVELTSGYLKPWSGKVTVSGWSAGDPRSRNNRRVCRSEPALFAPMTAKDHLIFACVARDADPQTQLQRATALGMAEWLDENAGNLSTGNTRKLWYLMNTVGDFNTLLLDEPFNGVDAQGVETMADEIKAWTQLKLVVVITHSLQDLLPEAQTLALEDLTKQPTTTGTRP